MFKLDTKEFSKQIMKELNNQIDDYVEDINKEASNVAKLTVKRLKAKSPTGTTKKKKYKRAWTSDEEDSAINIKAKVYDVFSDSKKKRWPLIHLLERGHQISNGTGRYFPGPQNNGKTRAYPHHEESLEFANNEFEERVRRIINEKRN